MQFISQFLSTMLCASSCSACFLLHCPVSSFPLSSTNFVQIMLNSVANRCAMLNPTSISKWKSKPSVVSRKGHSVWICFTVYTAFPLTNMFSINHWLGNVSSINWQTFGTLWNSGHTWYSFSNRVYFRLIFGCLFLRQVRLPLYAPVWIFCQSPAT